MFETKGQTVEERFPVSGKYQILCKADCLWTVRCEGCGQPYTKQRTLIARHAHAFCSLKCFAATKIGSKAEAICAACGKSFVRPVKRLNARRRAFCSHACYYSVRQQRPYIQWREGQRKARKAVSAHFKLEVGNVVHHHDGDTRNNALENLAVFRNQADHMAHHHGVAPVKPLWDGRCL